MNKDNIISEFKKIFKSNDYDMFISPGRIELLGNHTDHNNGKVLCASIDLNITSVVNKRNDDKVIVISKGYPKVEIALNDLNKDEVPSSKSLIKGVLFRLKELNYNIGGFNMVLDSNIPAGMGVSSSAAFENLIAKIESYYYNDDKITDVTIAKVSKYSENVYFNKPCGLLDQCAIACGGINYIDFKDETAPIIKNVKTKFSSYNFLLINTLDSHENLTPYYKAIKDDMYNVSSFFNKKVLREVDFNDLTNNKENITNKFGEVAYNRAFHYFKENERVKDAYNALENGDYDRFFNDLKESGDSSYNYLKNCYLESEEERLPKAINYIKSEIKDAYVRVHGGGFAGTILVVLKDKDFNNNITSLYNKFGFENVIKVKITDSKTDILK